MTKNDAEATALTDLFGGFLQRHNLPKAKVDEAYILNVAQQVLDKNFTSTAATPCARSCREGELVVMVQDPYVSQKLRLSTLDLIDQINAELPQTVKVERMRVTGR